MARAKTKQQLTIENEELRSRLQELEETLEAIRSGAVDAIVTSGPAGDQVYTLEGADHAYHTMVESMSEGAVTLMLDGTILYANRHFGEMTGAAPSGIIGRRFHDFVHASDQQTLDDVIDRAGSGGLKAEISLRNESDAEISVQIAASPIELSGANALTLVITDLSEQRRYEQIVAAEKLSRRILEQAQEAIAVCIDGSIVRANRALYDICGCIPLMQPFDQVLSLRMSESQTFSVAIPESGTTIRKQEVRYNRPDGKIFHLILSAGPIIGQEKKVIGTLISLMDITDRKLAEEALRASESRFRTLAEEMPHFVWEADADGTMLFANKRAYDYTRLTYEQAKTGGWLAVQHPVDAPAVEAAWLTALKTGGEYDLESRFRSASTGEYRWFRIKGSPVSDSSGRIARWVGTCTDIDDVKQAEKELRDSEEALRQANESLEQRVRERTMDLQNLTGQLERSRGELRKLASELVITEERERKRIAGVLHDEIAQTLAAARMRIDLLHDIPPGSKDQRTLEEAKALLVQSIQETRALMTDIGNPLLFDMGLKAACESLADRLTKKHRLRINCDMRDAYKHLNPDVKSILYQLVRELLNNVVKHSQAQNAHIAIDMENGYLRVKVTDNGVGFDPRTLGVPTSEGGYGLYSIRERLIAIDGSLSIESAPGAGTVVTAIVPAVIGLITSTSKRGGIPTQ